NRWRRARHRTMLNGSDRCSHDRLLPVMPPQTRAHKAPPRALIIRLSFLVLVFAMFAPALAFGAFGLSTATDYYTVDTGASPNLIFKLRRTDNGSSTQSAGDLMSLVYNGVEYQNQSKGSHINSGFDFLYNGVSAVSVSAAT